MSTGKNGKDMGYYGGIKKDRGFLDTIMARVEKDPLLGEKDRWDVHARLGNMKRHAILPNGEVPESLVHKALDVVADKRKSSEVEALSQDDFIRDNILLNKSLTNKQRVHLARKANKVRKTQEHMGAGSDAIDRFILKSMESGVNNDRTNSLSGGLFDLNSDNKGVQSPSMLNVTSNKWMNPSDNYYNSVDDWKNASQNVNSKKSGAQSLYSLNISSDVGNSSLSEETREADLVQFTRNAFQRRIVEEAWGNYGSRDWRKHQAYQQYESGVPKCNIFVYDMLTRAGAYVPLIGGSS